MNKKIFIGLIIILLLAGGTYYLWPQTNTSEQTKEQEDAANTEVFRNLFSKKFPKAEEISITITEATENNVRGTVSFGPELDGGHFFAAKIDSEWQIIQDGNGAIPCALSEYGFSPSMLSDCTDI